MFRKPYYVMRDQGQTEVLFYKREVLLSSPCSPILCREVLFLMLDSQNARTEICILRPLRLSFRASRIRSIAFVKESIVGAFSKRHLALFFFPVPFKHSSAHLCIYTKRNEIMGYHSKQREQKKGKGKEEKRNPTLPSRPRGRIQIQACPSSPPSSPSLPSTMRDQKIKSPSS